MSILTRLRNVYSSSLFAVTFMLSASATYYLMHKLLGHPFNCAVSQKRSQSHQVYRQLHDNVIDQLKFLLLSS